MSLTRNVTCKNHLTLTALFALLIKKEANEPNEVIEVKELDRCKSAKLCRVAVTFHHAKTTSLE